jgi:hypothetical protein
MKVCLGFASIVLASSAAFAQQAGPAPGAAGTTRGVASAVRFATTAELPAPGGQAQTYRLALGDIKVSGSKRVQVPPSGFYVATLVTNDVISVEGDQRVLRHTGDSWVVPAGQPLVLEPQGKNHTVLLEVFRVEPSPTR